MTSKTLILPAAGSGSRMDRETPKPYLELEGRTVLEHTLRRFLSSEGLGRVVVAASGDRMNQAKAILDHTLPASVVSVVVEGGSERQHSIATALRQSGDSELILVHDAVRPFVREDHIQACCEAALRHGGAVLGVPVRDTIKRTNESRAVTATPDRRRLWKAQTPQVFRRAILMEAYRKAEEDRFVGTDDASLVERLGRRVQMVEGDRNNFKVTYPEDLQRARILLEEGTE